jgi:N-acetylmuramoyl-L-alanine amidase
MPSRRSFIRTRMLSTCVPAVFFACVFASNVRASHPPDQEHILLRRGSSVSQISAYQKNGVWYASLEDLASRLAFRVIPSSTYKKLECLTGAYRLKCTADNPFVVLIEHASNTVDAVCQMPVCVEHRDNRYFVPLPHFIPVLRKAWPHALSFRDEIPALDVDAADAADDRRAHTGVNAADAREPATFKNTADLAHDTSDVIETPSARLAPREVVMETASCTDIPGISVDARRNGTLVRIRSAHALHGFKKELIDGVLRLTLPGSTIDASEIRQTPIGGGDITSVAARQVGPDAILDLELTGRVTSHSLAQDGDSDDLLLTLYHAADVEQVYDEEQQDGKSKKQDRKRAKWTLDCIVIDAGHGGKDPGAIGVNGVKEKNVTLGIALKLGDLIESGMDNVKVVYTRKDDRFIELDHRGKIANEAEGKLFVSIHCNSTEEKPTTANGSEVYLLRPGRTAEAIRVAEFENSVIKFEKDYQKRYKKLTDENFIIVTMAQSAYVKYSERFAELYHDHVKASRKLKSLGVKQAGFYVLVGASMPSVLIETGFISNVKEEAYLSSQAGQSHVATLIYQAIEAFAKEYRKSLSE